MIAAFDNALLYLISVLFNLAMGVFLTRVLLQAVRADFYNPISQLVWRATQAVAGPLQSVLPRLKGRFDIACMLVLYVLAFLYIEMVCYVLHYDVSFPIVGGYAVLKLLDLLLEMYSLFMFVQAILSWVGPGVSNPAANILWSLNEPLLRPVRRIVPPVSGLDFSPMIVMLVMQLAIRFIPLPGIF
jgi:YggT family protein